MAGSSRSLIGERLKILVIDGVCVAAAIAQTTAPATQPENQVQITSPQPQDLVPDDQPYAIEPGDLLQISISGLAGREVETTKTTRVNSQGEVSLPVIGAIKVAGMSDADAEAAIREVSPNLKVKLSVLEARSRVFSILGAVAQPGQYAIVRNDVRLSEAFALARGDPKGKNIQVIRRTSDRITRVIRVSGDALAAGEARVNVVVRPKDTVAVAGASEGPEYYIGGRVKRSGVYSIGGQTMTFRRALAAAGGVEEGAAFVTIVRRTGDKQEVVLEQTPLKSVLEGQDIELKGGEQIAIHSTTRPTTQP
jgi:polysaccharide export outer membrane protein